MQQFQDILGDSLFGGDATVAGIAIFAAVLAVVFILLKKNVYASLITAIPMAFIFSLMGLIPPDMMVILIVVCVLGLAATSKRTIGD